jgi:hypothetical protein
VLGRGGCPSVWTGRSQGSSCFNAGTSVARDNRLATSVQTHFFDSGSAAAVGRQERWTQRLFVWLAKGGEEGGKLREQRLRAESAKVVRSSALGRRPTRGGESARTRWSCGGSARPPNLQARRSHGKAHWQKETALWARWGAHRERVGQTRRQRLGVARRSANTHGIARCIPVFWVWGGR